LAPAILAAAGALLVQDHHGVWWAGRPDRPELVRRRQQGYEDAAGPRGTTTASRGFGDLMLKQPPVPVLVARPDVQVVDLTADDWAIVLAGHWLTSRLSEQEVADICWDAMAVQGGGPVEAAQALTRHALHRGAGGNATAIVMRLGWSQLAPSQGAWGGPHRDIL